MSSALQPLRRLSSWDKKRDSYIVCFAFLLPCVSVSYSSVHLFSTLLGATTLLAGLVHNGGGRVIGGAIIALITNLFSSRSPLQSFWLPLV